MTRARLKLVEGLDDALIGDLTQRTNALDRKWLATAYIELGMKQEVPTFFEMFAENERRKGQPTAVTLRVTINTKNTPHAFAAYSDLPKRYKNVLLSLLCVKGHASTLPSPSVSPAAPEQSVPTTPRRYSAPADLVTLDDDRRENLINNLLSSSN